QAVTATKENADKNHVLNSIEVGLPGALANKRFDLVIANILANPLIELANVIGSFVKPGGSLILSGILDSQYEQVIAAYSEIFEFSQPTVQDQWVMLAARRRDQ
ncbi:MAG: 50S ribosomal protein L11 methyltransferase, partial [Gammaproteobacteria bacterium]|nr:50S ribosomal protein L11 methyltransferase [Gammaproteobacteria bacterium]